MWTVATYVLGQKLKGRKQYPLVLMLEPLFRCNLACAGCGKIQYPAHVLKSQLTPGECFRAVDECGAPTVSIPGGEPLLHPQIGEIVEGLVARKKHIYLCTNALLLKEKIHLFRPSKYLTFSVHMDGQREQHNFSVCLDGGYDKAVEGINLLTSRDQEPWLSAWKATVYSRSGHAEEARRELVKVEQVSGSRADRTPTLLIAYSGTGQKERVLDLLERAYSERSNAVVQIKVDPMYDPIRNDPRFKDLLRRIGLE